MNIIFVTERGCDHVSFEKRSLYEVNFPQYSALDLETTGLIFNKNEVLLVVLGDKDVQYVIDWCSVDKGLLFDKMGNISNFIGHNLSFDLPWLISRGFNFYTGQIYDTMETELTLIKGTSHSVSLKETVKRRLNIDTFDKGITKEFTFMNRNDPFFEDRHIEYAAKDIVYLDDVRVQQENYLAKYGQQELTAYNNDMVIVTSYMKVNGVYLNKDKWMKLYYSNIAKADELELLMDEELNRLGLKQKKRVKQRTIQTDILGNDIIVQNKNLQNINYASSDQIKDIFSFFKIPPPRISKKVKGGTYKDADTTGAKELEEYLFNNPTSKLKDFIKLLLEYKVLIKRISTYGKGFIDEHCDKDSIIHPTYKINRTATGRLSSDAPNAQNIPKLKAYRECFEAREGNLLWTCDLSSAELRILASLAGDQKMKDLYNEGADLHGYLATPVYRYLYNDPEVVITKKTNPAFRDRMKSINFGIAYGSSAKKVAKILDVSENKAQHVLEIMRNEIPNAFKYLDNQEKIATTTGIIVFDNIFNQRRYFDQIITGQAISKAQKSAIGREGKNCALQGINSQMIKVAMVKIFEYIRENNLKAMLVLSVHDELVIEFPEDELEHTKKFEEIMIESSNRFLNGLVMEVEKNIGKCWDK